LTNQTFGEWKCLRPIKKNSHWAWECQCSCGKIKVVSVFDLINKKSLRCHKSKFDKSYLFKGYGCISGTFLNRIKKGATARNIDFNLTIEELNDLAEKQNFLCAMTGLPLIFPYNSENLQEANASLDRIDSGGGYHLENVQWVTRECNLAKQSLGKNEFIKLCIGITMNYLKESGNTENKDYLAISERVRSDVVIQLLHASMGLNTEAGELLDSVKRHIIYGSELDTINIKEELGDLMWYIALACRSLETDFEQICNDNIKKLSKRYPEKFTKECAENRDVVNELDHYGDVK